MANDTWKIIMSDLSLSKACHLIWKKCTCIADATNIFFSFGLQCHCDEINISTFKQVHGACVCMCVRFSTKFMESSVCLQSFTQALGMRLSTEYLLSLENEKKSIISIIIAANNE